MNRASPVSPYQSASPGVMNHCRIIGHDSPLCLMPNPRKTPVERRGEVNSSEDEGYSDACQKNFFHILYHTESSDFHKFPLFILGKIVFFHKSWSYFPLFLYEPVNYLYLLTQRVG